MTVSRCEIDHLVVTAPTLESGCAWVEQALGVAPGPGGAHPRMGTHNRLLRLAPGAFLEVIAVDPSAPRPSRPRWFGLDDPASVAEPRLATWAVRTADLRAWPSDLVAQLGAIETMTRGQREWLITIPVDGVMPFGGTAPAAIEWQSPTTSAALDLPPSGCALARLRLCHPDAARLRTLLATLALDANVEVAPVAPGQSPGVTAWIETPEGLRRLGACE